VTDEDSPLTSNIEDKAYIAEDRRETRMPRFDRTFDSNRLNQSAISGSEWKNSAVYTERYGPPPRHEKFKKNLQPDNYHRSSEISESSKAQEFDYRQQQQ
jgi:hypothetical protein